MPFGATPDPVASKTFGDSLLQTVAFHKAGHAVVMHLNGHRSTRSTRSLDTEPSARSAPSQNIGEAGAAIRWASSSGSDPFP